MIRYLHRNKYIGFALKTNHADWQIGFSNLNSQRFKFDGAPAKEAVYNARCVPRSNVNLVIPKIAEVEGMDPVADCQISYKPGG